MINAKQTRKIAEEAISERAQAQMEDVERSILYAAKNGQFSCQMKGTMMPQVIVCLKEMGYSIKNNTAMNECWTTISWGESSC